MKHKNNLKMKNIYIYECKARENMNECHIDQRLMKSLDFLQDME